jgi:hypothetical protein
MATALVLPAVPCRKTMPFVDYFGTSNVVSYTVVEETWRREQHGNNKADTDQFAGRSSPPQQVS